MPATCHKCNKLFDMPWMLRRHLDRKYPCVIEPIQSEITQNDSQIAQNDSQNRQELADASDSCNFCVFCNKKFSRIANKKRHEKVCKMKDNELWNLEKQCNLTHKYLKGQTCPYCDEIFSSRSNLCRHVKLCKEKENYKQSLIKLKATKEQTAIITNNNQVTNNNNTVNNNQVSTSTDSFNNNQINNTTNVIMIGGEYKKGHMPIERVLKMYLENRTESSYNVMGVAAELAKKYHEMLYEVPENRNCVIQHERSSVAKIFENGSWKKDMIIKALEKRFKETAKTFFQDLETLKDNQLYEDIEKQIYDKKKEQLRPRRTQTLEERQTQLQENISTQTENIHICVRSFSNRGFNGHPESDQRHVNHECEIRNELKRHFKVLNLQGS